MKLLRIWIRKGKGMKKIYVASSWKNEFQGIVVKTLRAVGFNVYDFKNPPNGSGGFHWGKVGLTGEAVNINDWNNALDKDAAKEGFFSDIEALNNSDACILVLPCGRSAHLELGYACGIGKASCVFSPLVNEKPDLMVKMTGYPVIGNINNLISWAEKVTSEPSSSRKTSERPGRTKD